MYRSVHGSRHPKSITKTPSCFNPMASVYIYPVGTVSSCCRMTDLLTSPFRPRIMHHFVLPSDNLIQVAIRFILKHHHQHSFVILLFLGILTFLFVFFVILLTSFIACLYLSIPRYSSIHSHPTKESPLYHSHHSTPPKTTPQSLNRHIHNQSPSYSVYLSIHLSVCLSLLHFFLFIAFFFSAHVLFPLRTI